MELSFSRSFHIYRWNYLSQGVFAFISPKKTSCQEFPKISFDFPLNSEGTLPTLKRSLGVELISQIFDRLFATFLAPLPLDRQLAVDLSSLEQAVCAFDLVMVGSAAYLLQWPLIVRQQAFYLGLVRWLVCLDHHLDIGLAS